MIVAGVVHRTVPKPRQYVGLPRKVGIENIETFYYGRGSFFINIRFVFFLLFPRSSNCVFYAVILRYVNISCRKDSEISYLGGLCEFAVA